MAKIFNFERFKCEKKLDKGYESFLSYVNKFFRGEKITVENMLNRLYFTIRYLEGHITGLTTLFLLMPNLSAQEQKKGITVMREWIDSISEDLKEIEESIE